MLKHARCNHQALIKLMRASKNPLLAGIKKAGLLVPQDPSSCQREKYFHDVFGRIFLAARCGQKCGQKHHENQEI
jgi:hypothetical protein